jgi:hypothetical protein
MNERFQMQGGKNWILLKKINANRFFFRASHCLEILKTTDVPLWNRIGGAWLWTQCSETDKENIIPMCNIVHPPYFATVTTYGTRYKTQSN